MIRPIAFILFYLLLMTSAIAARGDEIFNQQRYVHPPCFHLKDILDTKIYHAGGQCETYGMELIELNTVEKAKSPSIHLGSGNFGFKSKRGTGEK